MDLNKELELYIDKKYKSFQEKLCPTKYEILGVKIPTLRKISRKLLKQYNYQDLLNYINDNTFEEVMIKGLIIGNAKMNYQERINSINNFLPEIDNWAICDIFCGELKFVKENKKDFLNYLFSLTNNSPYYTRFKIVMLLNYYLENEYLDTIFNYLLTIKSDNYYVKMAISWCLSQCLVKDFNKTLKFMQKHKYEFDKWTYNKALQKGRESFKLDKDRKIILQNAKIK